MAGGAGADRARQLAGMVLVLVVGAAIGAFLHLRSVDPVGERDREVAAGILERLEEAGLAVQLQGSAPALRAGFRQHDMKFDLMEGADDGGGGGEAEADLPTECSFGSGEHERKGLVDRLYSRLFGVGDRSNEEVTSFASAAITSGDPSVGGGVSVVVLFTLQSPGSAREAAERLASQQGQDCVTGSFGAGAGGMPGTVTAIALPIGGSVGYRGDAGLPGGVTASFDFVALHRGKAVAFLISGGVAPRPPDAPLTLLAPLAASMEQSLGDEAA